MPTKADAIYKWFSFIMVLVVMLNTGISEGLLLYIALMLAEILNKLNQPTNQEGE